MLSRRQFVIDRERGGGRGSAEPEGGPTSSFSWPTIWAVTTWGAGARPTSRRPTSTRWPRRARASPTGMPPRRFARPRAPRCSPAAIRSAPACPTTGPTCAPSEETIATVAEARGLRHRTFRQMAPGHDSRDRSERARLRPLLRLPLRLHRLLLAPLLLGRAAHPELSRPLARPHRDLRGRPVHHGTVRARGGAVRPRSSRRTRSSPTCRSTRRTIRCMRRRSTWSASRICRPNAARTPP